MKRAKKFSLILALLVAISCIFIGCGKDELGIAAAERDPVLYLQKALKRTEDAMPSGPRSSEKLFKALSQQGAISLTLLNDNGGTTGGATLRYNSKDKTFSADISFATGGAELAIALYGNDHELCIAAPEILGDTIYGLPYDNLKEDLAGCQIWALMGVSYDDVKAEIEPILEELEKSMEGSSNSGNALTQPIQQAIEKIDLIFNEIQYSAVASGDNAVEITCTMTKAQMDKLVDILMDTTAEQLLAGLESSSAITGSEMTFMVEQLRAALKEVSGNVTVKVLIDNKSGQITHITADYDCQVEDEDVCFTLDADLTDLKKITVTVTAKTNGQPEDGTITLTIENNSTKTATNFKLTLRIDDDEQMLFSCSYDGVNFVVDGTSGNQVIFTLKGKLAITEKSLELSDVKFEQAGNVTILPVELHISTNSDVQKIPQYKNLLTMSQEDWTELMTVIGSLFPSSPAPEY